MNSNALRGLFLLLLLAGACKKAPAPERKPVPVVRPGTPRAEKGADDEDPAWLAGTWQKQGATRWLLFNLPGDVAELAGKPPRVVRRGKLSVHGAFISAVFDDEALDLRASADRAEISGPSGVYRRGAPP